MTKLSHSATFGDGNSHGEPNSDGDSGCRTNSGAALAGVGCGHYRCGKIHAEGLDALRVKRMGLCEGLVIEVLGNGDPMVLAVGTSRLGLSRFLAAKIEVHRVSVEEFARFGAVGSDRGNRRVDAKVVDRLPGSPRGQVAPQGADA